MNDSKPIYHGDHRKIYTVKYKESDINTENRKKKNEGDGNVSNPIFEKSTYWMRSC